MPHLRHCRALQHDRMDGQQLLEEIKRRWPELPAAMVTVYSDDNRRTPRQLLAKPDQFRTSEGAVAPVADRKLRSRRRSKVSWSAMRPMSPTYSVSKARRWHRLAADRC